MTVACAVHGPERGRERGRVVLRRGNGDFVPLSREAAIGEPSHHSPRELARGAYTQGVKRLPDARRVDTVKSHVQRREQLHPFGRGGETERRQHTGVRRNHHARHSQCIGERAPEQRAGAPERQERHRARIDPSRHADALERARHDGRGDLDDPRRHAATVRPERAQGPLRRRTVQADIVGQRVRGIEPTEGETRVGDGGLGASTPVTGGTGVRSGAARPHLHRPPLVHRGDASPARAHRLDEDRREREGNSRHDLRTFGQRHAAGHEARVGARPAHVERQQVGDADRLPDEPRSHDAARRPRQREARRPRRRRLRGERAAARRHDLQGRGDLGGRPRNVRRDLRPQVRLGGGRAGPFVLAEKRQDLVARDDRNGGQRGVQRVRQATLVRGVAEGEQQRHRHRPGRGRQPPDGRHHSRDLGLREGHDGARRSHSLDHADDVPALHQGRGVVARQIVQRRPVLAPQPQEVFESGGGDERHARAAALEESVRGDRRAVHEHVDGDAGRGTGDTSARCTPPPSPIPHPDQCIDRPKQAHRRIPGRTRHLADLEAAVGCDRDEIGKRPADVDADPHRPTSSPVPVRGAGCGVRSGVVLSGATTPANRPRTPHSAFRTVRRSVSKPAPRSRRRTRASRAQRASPPNRPSERRA